MPIEVKNSEVRSEEVQEILGQIPHWLIRWGITSIFIVVIFILTGSWFIKYPDVVTADITLTTDNPPAKIMSRSSGNLTLLVSDIARVRKGQFLGVIENAASTDDVLQLIRLLTEAKLNTSPFKQLLQLLPDNIQLGSLQSDYQSLLTALKEQDHFDRTNSYISENKSLSRQVDQYNQLHGQLNVQVRLQTEQVFLTQKDAARDSTLHAQGSESLAAWEATKSAYLQSQRSLEQAKASVTTNSIQIEGLRAQLNTLLKNYQDRLFALTSRQGEAFERLSSQLENWKQQYLLVSPIQGVVTFTNFWQNGQFINTGDEVMTIVPQSKAYYARAQLSLVGSGKVKHGNQVVIRFDNYPEQEYGTVYGTVGSIALVPRGNSYLVNVDLTEGLQTSYGRELEFRQEMQGKADIITEDLKLLDRIFNNLRKLLSN